MRGSFERTTRTTASPSDAWATLHDVDQLAAYSSHLGPVTTVEPDRRWKVSLQDRVGPFKLSAPMDVAIVEETSLVEISIRASGQDRGPGTRLVVEASVRLDQANGETQLALSGTYDLRGRVASLGGAVARRQAETMIDEFWTNLTTGLQ
ncbi:MAG: SRPBCC domain-containing protein [Acidimicrobiia bacterium]|jgi:carbon monoxide dehydrogenase subunit G